MRVYLSSHAIEKLPVPLIALNLWCSRLIVRRLMSRVVALTASLKWSCTAGVAARDQRESRTWPCGGRHAVLWVCGGVAARRIEVDDGCGHGCSSVQER